MSDQADSLRKLAEQAKEFYKTWTANPNWPTLRGESDNVPSIFDFAAEFASHLQPQAPEGEWTVGANCNKCGKIAREHYCYYGSKDNLIYSPSGPQAGSERHDPNCQCSCHYCFCEFEAKDQSQ